MAENLPLDGGDPMTGNLNMGNNKIINLKPPATKDNAASKEDVDTEISKVGGSNNSLPIDGSKPMERNLNMDGFEIANLLTDTTEDLSATNVLYVADLTTSLTASLNKKINESHISGSTNKKKSFSIPYGRCQRVYK